MTKGCHESPLWGPSPSFYYTPHYLLLPFLSLYFFVVLPFSFLKYIAVGCQKLTSPHVEGHIGKYMAHFNSKRLRDACLSCLMHCCFLLCTAPPSHLLSFVLLFSFSPNSSYSNLSRFLSPLFLFCMTASHLHFLTSSSSRQSLPSPLPSAWGFLQSPFHLLFALLPFFPSQRQSFLPYFSVRYLTFAYLKPLISKQPFST